MTFEVTQDEYLRKVVADREALLLAVKLSLPILEEELACLERSYLPEPNYDESEQLYTLRGAVKCVRLAISKAETKHQ